MRSIPLPASREYTRALLHANFFRASRNMENGTSSALSQHAKPCLQIGRADFIIRTLLGIGTKGGHTCKIFCSLAATFS
ncbi:hypothetical protein Brsp02_01163 [Brucella sp. NBRC 113783]